jgi:glycosyltransferase involved in cell wall biosynthesis
VFVFNWLVVGGEETEVRLLARNLDPARYALEVIACYRREEMPDQTHRQLEALRVPVDRAPYALSFEDTVDHLVTRLPDFDIVVGCQAPPDLYPALERIEPARRPPLVEHGGLVEEATRLPKHLTTRYVGVCRAIRDAAAAAMPGREHDAVEIPSMVDLSEFDPADRSAVRAAWGVDGATPVVGCVGRLDRKKRVEDLIEAVAIVRQTRPEVRALLIGGPDAFMPEYADELRARVLALGLGESVRFTGDVADVPRLLAGLDIFAWLARGEGMPHVIAEAGAARLPVIATRDNGTEQQIVDRVSGLFVPHESPPAVAQALLRLVGDPARRRQLGEALRRRVEREYSVEAVLPQWEALFESVLRPDPPRLPP